MRPLAGPAEGPNPISGQLSAQINRHVEGKVSSYGDIEVFEAMCSPSYVD